MGTIPKKDFLTPIRLFKISVSLNKISENSIFKSLFLHLKINPEIQTQDIRLWHTD